MRKIILSAALVLSALATFAQKENEVYRYKKMSNTEMKFDNPDVFVNIRDLVYLKNHRQMLIELSDVQDFDRLQGLDRLITKFYKDIQFYKDSLATVGTGNVRIDYSVWVDSNLEDLDDQADIRFKRYAPDGDIFHSKKGEVAQLKMEMDTVNFIIKRSTPVNVEKPVMAGGSYLPARVSFFVNNYTDLEKIAADAQGLQHILDTLKATKRRSTVNDPNKFPSTTIYRPFSKYEPTRFEQQRGILKREDLDNPQNVIKRSDMLTLTLNTGMGLVRNTFAPMGEAAISIYNLRRSFYTRGSQEQEFNTYVSAGISPYFLFDRGADGTFYVKDNWFVNLEIGGASNFFGMSTPLLTGGVSYLAFKRGDYFKGTTMKAFMSVKLKNSITICPEIIFTDNFRQIFPGFTIKLF